MTKREIVKTISEGIGLTNQETKEIVQKTFDAIVDTLVQEGRIELRNFGVFEVKKRAARKARNPRTGQRVDVPEKYGGSGRGPDGLLDAIEAFVSGGADLGLSLSWLDHLLIHALVIERFGTEAQKAAYLPALAAGERIGALAASEPGTGGWPASG